MIVIQNTEYSLFILYLALYFPQKLLFTVQCNFEVEPLGR